jgi:succinate dehydrogenase / fumarate reductase, iron-sulfur subunit
LSTWNPSSTSYEGPALVHQRRSAPKTARTPAKPEQRERFDDTTKCILCACCTTSCPSFWASDEYVGPAAMVTAHRFIFDSRDQAAAERLEIVSETTGWRAAIPLSTAPMACPRDIQVTKAIGELKMLTVTGKLE